MSRGSSARAVPEPTTIASDHARRRWTSALASSPVIHVDEPSRAAAFPSSEDAIFSTTNGRPERTWVRKARFCRIASSASRPSSTARPASRSVRNPLPSTMGFGSPVAAITRLDARGDQGARAGGRPAVVIAGLERHERRRAGRAISRQPQGHRLGVLGPGSFVPAFADHAAVAHEHAADERIG